MATGVLSTKEVDTYSIVSFYGYSSRKYDHTKIIWHVLLFWGYGKGWATPEYAQSLLLVLHSEITSSAIWALYSMLRIGPKLTACKANTLPYVTISLFLVLFINQ